MTSLCVDTQHVKLLSLEYVGVPSCDGSGGCVGGGLAQAEVNIIKTLTIIYNYKHHHGEVLLAMK